MDLPPADELRQTLIELEPDRFTSRMILDRVPWLWASREDYIDWKTELAAGLDVDPYSLVVVGSACTGVTLNPKKQLFRPFRTGSDVDVAVVSNYHFELAWKTIRSISRKNGFIPTTEQRRMLRQHREYLVFDETIATDWILPQLPFGETWREALQASAQDLPGERHDVKARIYREMGALRAYHVRNIARLKDALASADVASDGDGPDDSGAPLPADDPTDPENGNFK